MTNHSDERERSTSTASPAGEHSTNQTGVPPETAFDLLRNGRRRHAITYVHETGDDAVTIGDLAEQIAAIENDVAVTDLTSAERKRVYVSLYQSHLPRMADRGVVRFDQDQGIVRSGPNIDSVIEYLGSVDDQPDTSRCDIALAAAGTALLVVNFFLGWVSGHAVALVILFGVATCLALGRLR